MRYLAGVLALAGAVAGGWWLWGSSQAAARKTQRATATAPISVEVTRVSQRPMREEVELVGTLEAEQVVDVRSRTSGYIRRLPFDVGDVLHPGDVVCELDDLTTRQLLSRSESALKVAQAQLAAQQAKVDLARRDLQRFDLLTRSGATTEQQQDQARGLLKISEVELDLERARVDSAQSDVERSRIVLDELKLKVPEVGTTRVGYVSQRFAAVGDLAKPDAPLLQIVVLDTARTVVHVVERDYERVRLGQSAVLRLDAFPGEEFEGRVIRKAPVLDLDTRTAAVQIEIPNPKARLKPGMHARVHLRFGHPRRADAIPLAALVEQGERSSVFVVAGDPPTSASRTVQIGVVDGDFVEVVAGLAAGDRVVVLGNRLLAPGQVVAPIEVEPAEAIASHGPNDREDQPSDVQRHPHSVPGGD